MSPEPRPEAPPAGEEIHLPGPSFLPIIMALGITLAVVGITIHFLITVVGTIISAVVGMRWLRETRESIAELPLDHE